RVLSTVRTTFDLFESVRGLVDLSLTNALGEAAPPTPTPRVQRLHFANPLEIVLVGGLAIATVVGLVVERVSGAAASAAQAALQLQAVNQVRNEERRREERHRLEMKALQLDNLKKAIELSELLDRINPAIREIAGVEIPQLPPGTEARAEGLKDQAVEAATELSLDSQAEFTISSEVPPVESDDEA